MCRSFPGIFQQIFNQNLKAKSKHLYTGLGSQVFIMYVTSLKLKIYNTYLNFKINVLNSRDPQMSVLLITDTWAHETKQSGKFDNWFADD